MRRSRRSRKLPPQAPRRKSETSAPRSAACRDGHGSATADRWFAKGCVLASVIPGDWHDGRQRQTDGFAVVIPWDDDEKEHSMNPLYAFPPVCEQTLRALARYPSRTAFAWPGGSLTYRGATDLIGRMQGVFMRLGLEPGGRVA